MALCLFYTNAVNDQNLFVKMFLMESSFCFFTSLSQYFESHIREGYVQLSPLLCHILGINRNLPNYSSLLLQFFKLYSWSKIVDRFFPTMIRWLVCKLCFSQLCKYALWYQNLHIQYTLRSSFVVAICGCNTKILFLNYMD